MANKYRLVGGKDKPVIELNVDSKPIRFTMLYRICNNPKCGCNNVFIGLFNEEHNMGFYINFGTGALEQEGYADRKYTEKENDIINAFIEFIKSPETKKYTLDFFKNCYDKIKNNAAVREEAIKEFKPGELLPYSDMFGIETALKIDLNGIKYVLLDSYCVTPPCACTETGLFFYDEAHKTEPKTPDFSFVYDYATHCCREPTNVSEERIKEIIETALSKYKILFEKRHKKIKKEIMPYITDSTKRQKFFENRNIATRKLGRNEPCHCDSGEKYKKCCMDKDLQETGKAYRVAE